MQSNAGKTPALRPIVAPLPGSYNNPMTAPPNKLLRKIPSVEVLLEAAEARWLPAEVPRRVIVAAVRAAVAAAREVLQDAAASPANAEALRALILADVGRRVKATLGPHYRKAINATGIILHTGLGRAVLPARALRQIVEELSGFSVLQIDVAGGRRPPRRADRGDPPSAHRRGGCHRGQ